MLTRLLDALTRRLVPAAGDGHFHPGPRGPYPCHDTRCAGARVTSCH
jgi:hypothetical protein